MHEWLYSTREHRLMRIEIDSLTSHRLLVFPDISFGINCGSRAS